MKSLILGTAGHIDHGKTSLVKALTGIETDRLKEEKQRGITIELGFAWLDLPNKTHIGIVDVPGHEKFVRTMVAGAGGIDLVCLVIAADEGIMPQTREHFEICRLLNVKHGIVALTKVDMVDPEWLEMVRDEVEQYIEGTFLEGAPIVPVSSTKRLGLKELVDTLQQVAEKIDPRASADLLRLPIDRVFTMKGFGTVITGTLVGGSINTGQTVRVLPSNLEAKVRGLQVHGESVENATAGHRTAVNFQGIEKSALQRGQVLVKPEKLTPTYLLDAKIEYLASAPKPLAFRTRVRFHHHTAEVYARVVPMSDEAIQPGGSGIIQLRLEQPAVVVTGDRFILRSYSPVLTIGGGVVLHPAPAKHKSPFDSALADLKVLESGVADQKVALFYRGSQKRGLSFSNLPALTGLGEKQALAVYRDLLGKGVLVRFDTERDIAVHSETFESIQQALTDHLDDFHQRNPSKKGVSRMELAEKLMYGLNPKLLTKAIASLEKLGKVKRDDDIVSLAGHEARLEGGLEKQGERFLDELKKGELTPPTFKLLAESTGLDPKTARQVADLLVSQGKIKRVAADMYFDSDTLENLAEKLRKKLEADKEIDAQGFKEMTGLSRKFSIPLLEYFDAIKLTLRVGDKRVLRKS